MVLHAWPTKALDARWVVVVVVVVGCGAWGAGGLGTWLDGLLAGLLSEWAGKTEGAVGAVL